SSDEVTFMPDLHFRLHFRHYSGYLESTNKSQLHYWFFESQGNPSTDPVVLWLTGGPGCSSLLAAMTEQGPIRIEDDETLAPNPSAWNLKTNFLYLESPAGVGFSYNANGQYKTDDKQTAELNFEALKSFFQKFPQYAKNDFYITGESYGGVYVPTLAEKCLDRKFPAPFKGFAVGNGYLDQKLLGNSWLQFVYYHGLVDTPLWEKLVEECCHDGTKLRKCDFVGSEKKSCQKLIEKIHNNFNSAPINVYNIYAVCNQSSIRRDELTPEQVARRFLVTNLLQLDADYVNQLKDSPPCLNYDSLQDYLNRKDVRHALHIRPQSLSWTPCNPNIDYTNQYKSLAKVVRKLVSSGLKGLIYNGDVDTACNYLGDEWFAEELGFKTIREFEPWLVNATGQVGGFVKIFDGFAYTTIRGSGT
ncbi:PREDICTED: lysosomal protective protein-like, partial [Rhagoletis zephyria]|uniref:lysosomal protective protein-like n=1 Tax=Rhagoletis zephyria TaxID=28612 RepID=UPI000811363E